PEIAANAEKFVRAARDLNSSLAKISLSPFVFVEYAAGLEPDVFAGFFHSIRELDHVTAAVDSGHVGIWQARQTFARVHMPQDVCSLKTQPADLPGLMPDVQAAVHSALPTLLKLINELGQTGKPVHFHLHDGHPLSTFSPFGVADHLSFSAEIPLRF